MKQTIIIFVLSAFILTATAKIAINRYGTASIVHNNPHNVFCYTDYDLKDNTITFHGLPKNSVDIYVIDADGKIAVSGSLNRSNNMISAEQLPNGLYTIVLKQGAWVKMFGYFTDIVIKGARQ